MTCANFLRGVEFRGSLAPFFLHIFKRKKALGVGVSISPLLAIVGLGLRSRGWELASLPSLHSLVWNCALGVGS